MHSLFLGHEGSIFGVRISHELPPEYCQGLKRVIASCSDDRTIRIWDVSDASIEEVSSQDRDHGLDSLRTSHTGFNNEAFDSHSSAISDCLAVGWGHSSRVWAVRFLNSLSSNGSLFLLSMGEDATARTWKLSSDGKDKATCSFQLLPLECAANHNGKNIWSCAVRNTSSNLYEVVCGGADSKITTHALVFTKSWNANIRPYRNVTRYTMQDILSLAQPTSEIDAVEAKTRFQGKADFFRSYCFINSTTFLMITNSGKILGGLLQPDSAIENANSLGNLSLITQSEDLSGYSLSTGSPIHGVAFLASARGVIYTYSNNTRTLKKIHSVSGKVGELLAKKNSASPGQEVVTLLITVVGSKEARLLHISIEPEPAISHIQTIPISNWMTGSVITSMAYVRTSSSAYLILGFRRGLIAVYGIRKDDLGVEKSSITRIIENAHGAETITSLDWYTTSPDSSSGYLVSVGRDGKLTVHFVDLAKNSVQLFHQLSLPFGPNIEGLYFREQRLLVHGFSSKKWILYDITSEEEVMNVETGGAHRSWVFQPHSKSLGGTLVWTRAAELHICTQTVPSHAVFRSGGHGREIKAVAISPAASTSTFGCCIATGAEDTDIKIFQYLNEDLKCRTTIRKHTTGIQHLQWSTDGQYLFSSGGCEECTYYLLITLLTF